MCKIQKSNFEEYKKFCLNSLEPGIPQFCEDYNFDKLVSGDEIICILGYQYDQEGKTYLVGSFSTNSSKYVRNLVEWGKIYLEYISVGNIEIIVENNNKKFKRFAEFFGFKKTLAQNDINGIIYNVYIRDSECLLQQ